MTSSKNALFTRSIKIDEFKGYTLTYCLLTDAPTPELPVIQYGVSVMVNETGEERVLRNITPSKEKAVKLMSLIIRNGVTPSTLFDVVYDWLCM